jgi:hypothetical protein
MFELVIVEANKTPIFDDQRVLKNDLFKYAFVELKEDNIGLWQKEALMNIASDVATCDNLLFLDSDVYCENLFWLKNIDDVLNDKDVYLQPFKSCRGSLFDKIGFYSKIYVDSGNSAPEVGWLHNPGLCIGIRKKSFDLNQKANPFYLYGCGDNGMYYEMTSANGEEFYKTNTILSEVRRRNSPCKLESAWLDYELIHIDHGVFNVSFYRDSISTTLMTRASHMVILDDSGLVKWKRKDSVAESFVKNKYVSSDIYLACPRGRLSNKLILLMSVYQHLGKKYRICFPELSLYADDLPKLREFIREPGNKKTVISYDMLALDRIENHVVNSETFEFLTLSKSLQDQYDLIDLDFRNSIGIAIRQGDFKKFRKGEWHVKPENYLNDIDVHICDNPYIFSDEPTNINNIMNVSSEITNFQPVLDLLLLSKCEKIVRNRRSSFGWLASMIGKYNKTMKDERLVG